MLLYLLFLLLAGTCSAAGATTIDSAVLADLQRISGYAGSAYCAQNYAATTNGPAFFPANQFDRNGSTQVVYPFLNVGKAETSGLIMLDHAHQLIIITFRGTVSSTDWDTDLDFFRKDANDICKGCLAHSGFLDSWRGVSAQVMSDWKILQQQYGNYQTLITGHSLGGGLAHLCAAALKNANPTANMLLYTYASPRVGNQVFANFVNQNFGTKNYRVTHLNDPVPRVPGTFLGFAHTSPEYHITSPHIPGVLSADKKILTKPANMIVRPEDVLVIPGPENDLGNLGYSCIDINMHDVYFINIASCVVDDGTPLLGDVAKNACHALLFCCNFGLNFGPLGSPHPPADEAGVSV